MNQYETLLKYVYKNGVKKTDRTGTGTISVFGYQMRFDLNKCFPLITTKKKIHLKSIIHKLLWFLKGSTNLDYLHESGVTMRDEWANDKGELGPVAQVCNLKLGEFIHTFGDTHIYLNHFEQVDLQLSREPRPYPVMKINPNVKSIFDFEFEDFELEGYNPHPSTKAPIAV